MRRSGSSFRGERLPAAGRSCVYRRFRVLHWTLHGNARRLFTDLASVRTLILAVGEGWDALDKIQRCSARLAVRAIFRSVPLPFAGMYWHRLLRSPRGKYYFRAPLARQSAREMATLAS